MRNLLIEAESGKPAPGRMHLQLLDQPAIAGDAVETADQQDAQRKFRTDRGPAYRCRQSFNFSRTKSKLMCLSMRRSRWFSGT